MHKRLLVLGSSGMLGSCIFKYFSKSNGTEVFGLQRKESNNSNIFLLKDILNQKELEKHLDRIKPTHIINCIGVIKQSNDIDNSMSTILINSYLPHYLYNISNNKKTRLIHFSTDCVFSGKRGKYSEEDFPDADDLYGRSKLLGEINKTNALTLRTSIIGHEINSKNSLLEWFLSQKGSIKGYRKAIFSGLTTLEIASILDNFILDNNKLDGLYNLSSDPIDKYSLLNIVKEIYEKDIEINEDNSFIIDRSLDSSLIRNRTNLQTNTWYEMIKNMHEFNRGNI
jgi:dTDP-4-dehydrorhamnose reductase